MYRKTHHLVLLGTICLLCSCIDNTYDLKNKEISLDMAIEGNKIALPLGNLKPILLKQFGKCSVRKTEFRLMKLGLKK
jgi:hypothetical protein